jgi:hypothetical protein
MKVRNQRKLRRVRRVRQPASAPSKSWMGKMKIWLWCRLIPYLHQRPIFFKANSIHSSIVAILELISGAQCLIEVIRSSGEEIWRVDAYQIPYYIRGHSRWSISYGILKMVKLGIKRWIAKLWLKLWLKIPKRILLTGFNINFIMIEVIRSSGEEIWRVDAYQIPYYIRGIEEAKRTHPRFADCLSSLCAPLISSKMATIDECIEFALKNIGLWWRYGIRHHCDEWKYIIFGRKFESEIILIPPSLNIGHTCTYINTDYFQKILHG